jgi:Family of unknown function (DUF5677)
MNKKSEKKRAKRQRHHTALAEHKRDRKKLVTPFNALPNLRPIDWVADILPEHLFTAAMLEEYGHPEPAWRVLEALQAFVPADGFLDGHVSTFGLVPEDQREGALAALARPDVPPLPDELRACLTLYPEGPAVWLAMAAGGAEVDSKAALAYLRELVAAIFNSRGVPATRARLVVLGRWVRARRIRVPPGFVDASFIPRYPGELTEGEQRMAESEIRAMYSAFRSASAIREADSAQEGHPQPDDSSWAATFWRANLALSRCEMPERPSHLSPADGSADAEQAVNRGTPTVADLREQLMQAGERLAADLRAAQEGLQIDLYSPESSEVDLALAARQVRLLRLLLSDAHLWNGASAAFVLRALVDGLITSAWLLARADPNLYLAFRGYGLGKLKLFKLHLEDHFESRDDEPTQDELEFLDQLEEEVSSELLEEFIDIDLGGTFAGVNVRQMAEEAGLKPYYNLAYQPYSSDAHGDWVSLKRVDAVHCGNPLHRYHRIGRFGHRSERFHPEVIQVAAEVTRKTVESIFDRYAVDVGAAFERFDQGVFAAPADGVAPVEDGSTGAASST